MPGKKSHQGTRASVPRIPGIEKDSHSNILRPVDQRDRLLALDVLRGIAILGVLIANSLTFAFPAWSAAAPGSAEQVSFTRLVVGFIVEGKCYVLFAILFGMSLALQSARAASVGRGFNGLYCRRLAVLFLFGIAHGVLLYSGDILAFYAVLGMVAMTLRGLNERTLFLVVIGLMLANVVTIGVNAKLNPGTMMPTVPDWETLAEQHRAEVASEPGSASKTEMADPDRPLDFLELMANETRIFQSGSSSDRTRHRFAAYFLVGWPLRMAFTALRVLAFFLLGVYLVRRGIHVVSIKFRRTYVTALWSGLLIGLVLQLFGGAVQVSGTHHIAVIIAGVLALLMGGLIHALAYASGVAWLCLIPALRPFLQPIAAVGRMALSNYLMSSAVFGLIFYGSGFGLMGRTDAGHAVTIAVVLFMAQLVLSFYWMRWFRFGPFEWVWRSLTYWRRQSFLSR